MSDQKPMTKGERDDLMRLIRSREKVMKTAASQRALELMAEFEKQISAIYHYDNDETWAKIHAETDAFVAEAQKRIEQRCEELGIAKEFYPELALGWYSRGESAASQRRAELRTKAKSEIAAIEEKARAQIEIMSTNAMTEILSHGLVTSTAKDFLQNLTAVEKLMPMFDAGSVVKQVEDRKKHRYQ